jgi:hypothetical protein
VREGGDSGTGSEGEGGLRPQRQGEKSFDRTRIRRCALRVLLDAPSMRVVPLGKQRSVKKRRDLKLKFDHTQQTRREGEKGGGGGGGGEQLIQHQRNAHQSATNE